MGQNHLLVVEDNEKIAELVCKVADELGFTSHMTDSEKFFELYEKHKPGIIVLDILMPEVDGFEVLKYLGENNSRSHILILSGKESYRTMAESYAHGIGLRIDMNMSKPFRIDALRKHLQNIQVSLGLAESELSKENDMKEQRN